MLDDTLLSDAARLVDADRAGMLRTAAGAGALVRSTVEAALDADVAALSGMRPRALVLLTRPGAGELTARLTAALLGPSCSVPVMLAASAPAWLGPLDVVSGYTVDPADEELAVAVATAVRRGAEVVLCTPEEGPVAAAGAGRARLLCPRVPVPPGFDLPCALTAALSVTTALGLLRADLGALADELDREAERDHPQHEPFVNPAKTLALRLADRVPLLWGVDESATALAGCVAAALASHAGVVAQATSVAAAALQPALLRWVAGAGVPEALFADPFTDPFEGPERAAPQPRVVLLGVRDDDITRARLAEAERRWPDADVLHPVDEVAGGEDARAAAVAVRACFAAVYLGLAGGTVTAAAPDRP